MDPQKTRRAFLKNTSLAGLGAVLGTNLVSSQVNALTIVKANTPAVLGGEAAWAKVKWVKWPIWNPETDEKRVLEVLRSGVWSRQNVVLEFESEWAKVIGTKRCMTTVNGTNALIVAINQFGIGAGDEVLVTPYTFISTVQSILINGAIPVFVDVDQETFQMDPAKIENKITSKTKAILPVHILGLPADMNRIMAIAKKHKLLVIEDACQAPLAEIDGKRVGSIGDAGCFSFQNSKNIPIGEGGAITTNNEAYMDKCFSYHNLGLPFGSAVGTIGTGSQMLGTKVRWTEYQAAIGLAQLARLEGQTDTRTKNAAFLKSEIQKIPGIIPYKLYDSATRAAFHLFPFRYKKEEFKGLSREAFLGALRAEGIPVSSGYTTLNTQPFIPQTFASPSFKKIYSKQDLDYKVYMAKNACPQNDQLCNEAVWFTQNMLLNSQEDLAVIPEAIQKIYKNAEEIKKTSATGK